MPFWTQLWVTSCRRWASSSIPERGVYWTVSPQLSKALLNSSNRWLIYSAIAKTRTRIILFITKTPIFYQSLDTIQWWKFKGISRVYCPNVKSLNQRLKMVYNSSLRHSVELLTCYTEAEVVFWPSSPSIWLAPPDIWPPNCQVWKKPPPNCWLPVRRLYTEHMKQGLPLSVR